jgi:hypothetical protein
MSPSAFYEAFLHVTAQYAKELDKAWTSCSDFTRLMLATSPEPAAPAILPDIAGRLGLHCYGQYYTLDAIYYVEKDEVHFPGCTYAKFISVALEHENNARGSVDEIYKLQLFSAPLKVLITYPANPDEGDELLRQYAEIIAEADPFNDIATLRRQLVIFGFRTQAGEAPGHYWRAFAYREDGSFTPVQGEAAAPA